ncbi:MAG: MATE family efflux transporter [Rhodobacteraceae bacterium]|nr:MATE family efflux transporter [Paracoccaceae bacterium]
MARRYLLSWRTEAFVVVKLAAPLAMTQLAFMAMVSTDILMMGWLGSKQLATGTLAGHYFWLLEFFGMGLLTSVTPIISHHLGAGNLPSVRRTVRQGFWAGVIIFIPCVIVAWWSGTVLVLLGQEPDISMTGQSYIRALLFGLLPGLWHVVLGETLAAHERPRAALIVAVCAIFVNAAVNYTLMFGHFGFPALGLVGAGIGTSIVATLMFLSMLFFVALDKDMRKYNFFVKFWRADWPQLFEIFRIGVPIALTEMSEIATVFVAALLMGLISVDALAAHGITVQCIGFFLMVPVGFMQAASIRVGHTFGAKDLRGARLSAYVTLSLNLLYITVPITLLLFFGEEIVAVFLNVADPQNAASAAIATSVLALGSLFLLADSMHLVARGALMGLKDTKVPMFFSLLAYGASLPAAWYLAIHLKLGPESVWLSLSVPLLVLAGMLIWRFNNQIDGRQS